MEAWPEAGTPERNRPDVMELSQALRSTGAVRDFTSEAVPDDVVFSLLDTARFAPNGGNRQAWHVILVRDPSMRVALRDLYLPGWYEYLPQMEAGLTPFAAVTDADAEAIARSRAPEFAERGAASPGFAEQLHQVPVLMVLTADLRNLATLDRDLDRYTMVGGASIYPFAWSLLLAAHDAGLGGVITTVAIRKEPELRELFRLPEHVVVAAVLAFGYPAGKRATKLRRNPVESFATVDRYDGAAFTVSARISAWRIANHPSGDSLQTRHASRMSSSSARVANPRVEGLIGERRRHDPVRPDAAPPRAVRVGSEAPHRCARVGVREPRGPRPLQQAPPGIGFGIVAAGDLVVQLEPPREPMILGEPGERRVVGVARGHQTTGRAHTPHLPQRGDGIGEVLEHLVRVHDVERVVWERRARTRRRRRS